MYIQEKVYAIELQSRSDKFISKLDSDMPQWEVVALFGKMNQLYFTGTVQEGVLIFQKGESPLFFVRSSYERAVQESSFPGLMPMGGYRDVVAKVKPIVGDTVLVDANVVNLSLYTLFNRYFNFKVVLPVDSLLATVRAIKSSYELDQMRISGKIHHEILTEIVPKYLYEGISEAQFLADIFPEMVKAGHQSMVRFGMFQSEIAVGLAGFGVSSIYPTSFNGPGGGRGESIPTPVLGSRDVHLKSGDLVFCDIPCGFNGYHTDKTETYVFNGTLPDRAIEQHNYCLDIEDRVASMLKPGAVPSEIYNEIMLNLDPAFADNFMGFGNRQVKFLGHSIGLFIDEMPVIAKGFDEPIEAGMVFALEPKIGVEGVGMVGIENTFIVTESGGEKITGEGRGLIFVDHK